MTDGRRILENGGYPSPSKGRIQKHGEKHKPVKHFRYVFCRWERKKERLKKWKDVSNELT